VRRVLLALAVAATCLGLTPLASASTTGRLVIVGNRSASAIVSLPALRVGALTLDVQMHGTYAGYFIFALRGDTHWPVAAQVAVPGLALGRQFAIPVASGRQLPAGRYELVLFTDGPAVITIPTGRAGTVRVHPTTPVHAWARQLHTPAVTAGVPLQAVSSPPIPAGTWMEGGFVKASSSANGAAAYNHVCVTPDAVCGANNEVMGAASVGEVPNDISGGVGYHYWAGMDIVDFAVPGQSALRADAVEVNANDRAFAWGLDL
jgi:hypothetical protein